MNGFKDLPRISSSSTLAGFDPTPGGYDFSKLLDLMGSVAGKAANIASGGVTGALTGGDGGTGINVGKLSDLMERQIKSQEIMQSYSMASNISRTEHETAMTSIRNARLG